MPRKPDCIEASGRNAAIEAGFNGDNPQVIAGLVLVLSDVLALNGYPYTATAIMLRNIANLLDEFAAENYSMDGFCHDALVSHLTH